MVRATPIDFYLTRKEKQGEKEQLNKNSPYERSRRVRVQPLQRRTINFDTIFNSKSHLIQHNCSQLRNESS